MTAPPSRVWRTSRDSIEFGSEVAGTVTRVMGIINVTPDSFSDGGRYRTVDDAVEQAVAMQNDGASVIDVGGESTRPGSHGVEAVQEQQRVIPVIRELAAALKIPISIDTSKAGVAEAAIEAGASIINDVTGLLGDPKMVEVAKRSGAGVCAMHMRGTPQTMQDDLRYDDVVEEIYQFLVDRRDDLLDRGIDADKICLDPGIGFGKSHQQNWTLVRHSSRFLEAGCPILIGHSRKGFISKAVRSTAAPDAEPDVQLVDAGTLGVTLALAAAGVHMVRVHEVRQTVAALKTHHASLIAGEPLR